MPSPSRRAKSPWGEGAALREEILAAATKLLADVDHERGLSLRAVAREVGIAAPSIYLHFEDRGELVTAVTERAYRELATALRAAREESGATDIAGVRAMADRYCAYFAERRVAHRLMFRLERSPVDREEGLEHPAAVIYQEWLAAATALRPDADEHELRSLATQLWVSVHGLADLTSAMPSETDAELLDEVTSDLLRRIFSV